MPVVTYSYPLQYADYVRSPISALVPLILDPT